jgi:hypothetical protein
MDDLGGSGPEHRTARAVHDLRPQVVPTRLYDVDHRLGSRYRLGELLDRGSTFV